MYELGRVDAEASPHDMEGLATGETRLRIPAFRLTSGL